MLTFVRFHSVTGEVLPGADVLSCVFVVAEFCAIFLVTSKIVFTFANSFYHFI